MNWDDMAAMPFGQAPMLFGTGMPFGQGMPFGKGMPFDKGGFGKMPGWAPVPGGGFAKQYPPGMAGIPYGYYPGYGQVQ